LPRGEPSAFAADARRPGATPDGLHQNASGHDLEPNDTPLDIADDIDAIPPRGWLLGNTFCRGFLSGLVGQGAAGKTSVRLVQLLSLASGRPLSGERVFLQCRVLLVCLEDSLNELRRRVRAAILHYGIDREEMRGRLFMWAPLGRKVARQRDNSNEIVPGELAQEIRDFITRHQIDVVLIDPLVKAHTIEENNNTAMDQVAVILSTMANELNCAVDWLQHQRKGSAEAGDAERARGASSAKDAARLVYTITPMSELERDTFGLSEAERRSLVRLDSAKVNIAPPSIEARWFKIVGVSLGNGNALYPNGDEIQVAELWQPPDMWQELSTNIINRILDDIEAGPAAGRRYSSAPSAGCDRAAWSVVQKHAPNLGERQCRVVIATWEKTQMVETRDYQDAADRKSRKGLFVVKRPG
jgi:hypothetical protein